MEQGWSTCPAKAMENIASGPLEAHGEAYKSISLGKVWREHSGRDKGQVKIQA